MRGRQSFIMGVISSELATRTGLSVFSDAVPYAIDFPYIICKITDVEQVAYMGEDESDQNYTMEITLTARFDTSPNTISDYNETIQEIDKWQTNEFCVELTKPGWPVLTADRLYVSENEFIIRTTD